MPATSSAGSTSCAAALPLKAQAEASSTPASIVAVIMADPYRVDSAVK
jgi:hypothetical protein